MSYLLTNCRVYTGDQFLLAHDVLMEGNAIQAVIPQQHRPAHIAQVHGQGLNVCPGFVDLQLYGGGDSAFGLAPSMAAAPRAFYPRCPPMPPLWWTTRWLW
jgi:N-acetylglucosamine-6-phosphate deacetylase